MKFYFVCFYSVYVRHNNSFIIRLMCNVHMCGGGCVGKRKREKERESISVYIFHVMYIIYT